MLIVLVGVFALKKIRVRFKKTGYCKYISHLDLVRCMSRAVKKADLPMWYTKGFNPHPYMSFPLPLPLGFEGQNEILDIKLDDKMENDMILSLLNENLPEGIRITKVSSPKDPVRDIKYALYQMKFSEDGKTSDDLRNKLNNLFSQKKILVTKTTKSCEKEIDLLDHFETFLISKDELFAKLSIFLEVGSENNINPLLFVGALKKYYKIDPFYKITRVDIFNENMERIG